MSLHLLLYPHLLTIYQKYVLKCGEISAIKKNPICIQYNNLSNNMQYALYSCYMTDNEEEEMLLRSSLFYDLMLRGSKSFWELSNAHLHFIRFSRQIPLDLCVQVVRLNLRPRRWRQLDESPGKVKGLSVIYTDGSVCRNRFKLGQWAHSLNTHISQSHVHLSWRAHTVGRAGVGSKLCPPAHQDFNR